MGLGTDTPLYVAALSSPPPRGTAQTRSGLQTLQTFFIVGRRTRTEKISCRLNSPAGSPGSCKGLSNELLSRHPGVSERRNKSFLLWETIGENQTLCCYCLVCLDEWVIIPSRQMYFSIVIIGHFSQSVAALRCISQLH